MVQWAYGDETPLHIVGAPEGTPPVMSQREVRQGNTLGPLLFALTLQLVLERVAEACKEAPLVSYLDDTNIVGKLRPTTGTFRRLCMDDDAVRSIGLEPRLPKCGIYGSDKELVPPKLPTYGSHISSTASSHLPRLWGQQSTSPTP